MKFLVDANLLCEPTKLQRNQKAVDWFQDNVVDCVTDAVVIGEIWRGIDRLHVGRRRANLEAWFAGLRSRVCCLDWTREVAIVWGGLINEIQRAGFSVGIRKGHDDRGEREVSRAGGCDSKHG